MTQIKFIPDLPESWSSILGADFQEDYVRQLEIFLAGQKKSGRIIFPESRHTFAALELTPFEKVKVVILGQDPYHGPGQAHGLSFSVPKGVPFPPSLKNIFKELKTDLGAEFPLHGSLDRWAEQGVLLLNAVLTVEQSKPASHHKKGWEQFTDAVIRQLNVERQGIVFVLWGSSAQTKGALIDRKKHLVLESPHPSPLSSYRGFFGSKPFSKTNQYLQAQGKKPIDWKL